MPVRRIALRSYVNICVIIPLAAAVRGERYDPGAVALLAICLLASFWRLAVYAWLMVIALLLAGFNIVHMFPSYWTLSTSVSSGSAAVTSVGIDPRPFGLLLLFVLIAYPTLKCSFLGWLNAGEGPRD